MKTFIRAAAYWNSVGSLAKFRSFCSSSSNSNNHPFECWNCKIPFDCSAFFCASCGTAQPIIREDGTHNYYSLFGLKQSFDLDAQQLSTQFKDLQRIIHPDKFGRRPEKERRYAEQCSTVVNEAYNVLSNPLLRAKHLLHLNGVPVDENAIATDETLLMTVMELNEDLSEVGNRDDLEKIDAHVSDQIAVLEADISRFFAKQDFEGVKNALVRARYFVNLKEKIKEIRIKFVTANSHN